MVKSLTKTDIRTLSIHELESFCTHHNIQSFRAQQLHDWLWKKNCHSFDEMTNLSKEFRVQLKENFSILPVRLHTYQKSKDGTIKNAISLHDDYIVECVLIPTAKRTTACVSSQVGCSLDCTFCATAQLQRKRNLTAAEIVDQVVLIDKQSREHHQKPLSNIVFMGMGEPLLNYPNLVKAIQKITKEEGLQMSPKRITVSTSGIPKMIEKLADENLKVNLALSLHSAIEEKRNTIMPFSTSFPLEDLQKSLQYWYQQTKLRITFEYIVWKGINDTDEDIQALVKFAKQVPSKVNIIEYNSIDGGTFENANPEVLQRYVDQLEKHKIVTKIRRSRGSDIDAACGQLANKENT